MTSHLHIEQTHDNLRRMGCYIIINAYTELERWLKPPDRYTPEQILLLIEEGDPIAEMEEFFFGPDGVACIIKTFDLSITISSIRDTARLLINAARPYVSKAIADLSTLSPDNH